MRHTQKIENKNYKKKIFGFVIVFFFDKVILKMKTKQLCF